MVRNGGKYTIINFDELSEETMNTQILFVAYSEEGAQGEHGTTYLVYENGVICRYCYISNGKDYLYYLCPMIQEWEWITLNPFEKFVSGQNGTNDFIPHGWIYRYMGCGNHLFVNKKVEKSFCDKTYQYDTAIELYQHWMEIATRISLDYPTNKNAHYGWSYIRIVRKFLYFITGNRRKYLYIILNERKSINNQRKRMELGYDLGEGMEVIDIIGHDGWRKPLYLINHNTQCAYEFIDPRYRLLTISEKDIDWDSLRNLPEEVQKNAKDLSFKYPSFIHGFKNGIGFVSWQLNPYLRHDWNPSDFGKTDDKRIMMFGFIDKNAKAVVKFRHLTTNHEIYKLWKQADNKQADNKRET